MPERTASVRSHAKINLDLRVLHKRTDGYHELRTVFQTISLSDTIDIRYRRAPRTRITMDGNVDIPDNLIVRAAQNVMDAARITAEVSFRLDKRIPMGAGLGGGSSNAAAVLLALPTLAGAKLPMTQLVNLGTALGSDVPFFLHGGTALGIGRGTELYPLAEVSASHGLLVAPRIHVSTADAYRDLNRSAVETRLTTSSPGSDTESFRALVWSLGKSRQPGDWKVLCTNDFENVVFERHPALQSIKRQLGKLGASPALMTGSGSALFGLFDSRDSAARALLKLSRQHRDDCLISKMAFLNERRYRQLWRRQLARHITSNDLWPPQSRYSKP